VQEVKRQNQQSEQNKNRNASQFGGGMGGSR
jgi:hypothetical protein